MNEDILKDENVALKALLQKAVDKFAAYRRVSGLTGLNCGETEAMKTAEEFAAVIEDMLTFNKKAYLKSRGAFCLYCSSDNFESGSICPYLGDGAIDGTLSRNMFCHDCKGRWHETYELTDAQTGEI